MFFGKRSKRQSKQARLEMLNQQYQAANDAFILEQIRGQVIDLLNLLKQLERFWHKEPYEFEGVQQKAFCIYNIAREAVKNIVENTCHIERKLVYRRIVESLCNFDSQFDIRNVEELGALISIGECVVAEDEQQRRRKEEEAFDRLTDALLRILSLGKIKNIISCIEEIEGTTLR